MKRPFEVYTSNHSVIIEAENMIQAIQIYMESNNYDTPICVEDIEPRNKIKDWFDKQSLPTPIGWIKCSERLPEVGVDKEFPFASKLVIVSDKKGNVTTAIYEKSSIGKGWIDKDGNDLKNEGYKVVFWQPLPDLPKESEGGK